MNFHPESFRISTPSNVEILVEREFAAAPERVFDAFTQPEWVRRWLLGPDGWTMPVCEIDLRIGGRYRYVWRKEATGYRMGMGGVFLEVSRPVRIVATERFDDAWYPGEAINTTVFECIPGGGTRVRLTMRYESEEARNTASRSGMERGIVIGYNRLEQMLEPGETSVDETAGIAPPELTGVAPRPAAVVRLRIPREQMHLEMPKAVGEILAALRGQELTPAGPLFAHHFTLSSTHFDFEAGFPVAGAFAPVGRVSAGEQPGGRIARTVYRGAYEGLFAAWAEFGSWMRRQCLTGRGDIWEIYALGPESSADPAAWRTELCLPLGERSGSA